MTPGGPGGRYDVAVVGGGPAGAAAALTLARLGRRVLLADSPAGHAVGFKVGESLPPAARPILHALGVWDALLADGHLPSYGNASVWGSETVASTDFLFSPYGPGWHLDRGRFDGRLRRAAEEAGADLWRAAVRVRRAGGGGAVDAGGPPARCDWVIDASGRRAAVARRQGTARSADDRLICAYARFRPADTPDPDARTLIEAAADGWWYTAPVPGRGRVVAYLTDADLAPPRLARSPAAFLALLAGTAAVGPLLAARGYRPDSPLAAASAHSGRLDPPAGPGWVAVGDAALSLDPLSSQGILSALRTGVGGAEAAHAHLAGDSSALASYSRSVADGYRAYLRQRADSYALERRWPARPFWRRRHPPG